MPHYMYFLLAVALLVLGYFVYGRITQRIFGNEGLSPTPVCRLEDGVDYVRMSHRRLFFIQLLNIAGLGPIFGPIMGALYGPSALLWVVLGCIFIGGVHDFFAGMLSVKYDGQSVPEVIGYNLGRKMERISQVFIVVMLVMVGVVFVAGPAGLLAEITGLDMIVWVAIIFVYFALATVMPVDKIIGHIYPFFGFLMMFMVFGLLIGLCFSDYGVYNGDFFAGFDEHPAGLPVWPMVFITIACGAASGFHATQSTITARCLVDANKGRQLFYGAMIVEGIIALVWVTLGMSVYQSPAELDAAMGSSGNAALAVKDISFKLLGSVGGVLAIVGVVVFPVTSGDTALRAARLLVADALNLEQKTKYKRFVIAVPMFAVAIVLSMVDFSILWRYFGWGNQTLAALVLWAGAVYLYRRRKWHWLCSVPAFFMTAVTVTYISYEKGIGLAMPYEVANMFGLVVAVVAMLVFLLYGCKSFATEPARFHQEWLAEGNKSAKAGKGKKVKAKAKTKDKPSFFIKRFYKDTW